MAKQLVNPIERHVEKVAVAVSALALLGAAALFLISSPNKLELGGVSVTPAAIDGALANHSEEIRGRLRNHRPTSVVPEPLAGEFVAATKQDPSPVFVSAAPIRPSVPLIDPPITKVADFSLVEVVTPAKPAVASGRSTVNIGALGNPVVKQLDWATITAVFDRKTQSELQKRAFGAANGDIYIAPPEVQRRARRADGTWSDGDWASVAPNPAGPGLPVVALEVEEGPDGPMIPFDQKKGLDRVLVELTSASDQRDRLRPYFHQLINGDDWSFPILTSYLDVLLQDDEVLYPGKAPAENPVDSYDLLDVGGTTASEQNLGPAQQLAADMQRAKDVLARAKEDRSKFDARSASNLFFAIKNDAASNTSLRNEAAKLETEADQLFRQYEREELVGRGPARGIAAADGDKEPVRKLLPTQQLWVHDAAPGSISGGETNQYRMRFRIYNVFAGEAAKFENPKDATKVLVASDWSPPSDPVSFAPWGAFFVTTDDKTKKQVGFEFFQWYYGAWVRSRRHKLGVGEAVQVTQRITVPSVVNPGESDSIEVDFDAAVSILDIDFSRAYRERRKGSGSEGVKLGPARDETAVVLVDSQGRLTERLVPRDKDHPEKKELGDRVYKGSR